MMTEKQMSPKQNKLFPFLIAIVVIGLFIYSVLTSDLEHIEDANGPDNYALAVITDEDIIRQEKGALGVGMSTGLFNDGITFKSKKFTGVYTVFRTTMLFDSDFLMQVAGFYVNSGNFRMALVNDGKIVAEVEPGMFPEVQLKGLNGAFELVIAGESANFEFTLDRLFCEQYGITMD